MWPLCGPIIETQVALFLNQTAHEFPDHMESLSFTSREDGQKLSVGPSPPLLALIFTYEMHPASCTALSTHSTQLLEVAGEVRWAAPKPLWDR